MLIHMLQMTATLNLKISLNDQSNIIPAMHIIYN